MSDKTLGSADAFGLDEFGMPVGINPLWGAVAGTGLSTLGSMGVRQFAQPFGKVYNWSEAIGFGIGALGGGIMVAFEGTRAAGWTALASAFLNSGLRQLEQMLLAPDPAKVAAAMVAAATAAGAVNGVVIEQAQALKGVVVEQSQALKGAANAPGFAEAGRDMPQLVGAGLSQANNHIQLVGGPALSQHAGAFGSTLFNKR